MSVVGTIDSILNKAHLGFAGVYGAVLMEGVVKAGDTIQVLG